MISHGTEVSASRHVSYSLNSLKGIILSDVIGDDFWGYEGGYREYRLWLM